jgi:hypothetical protein
LARLVYETPDRAFAERAIKAMRDANISCYHVAPDYSALYVPKGEAQVCIYIANESDYAQANDILVKLGAATDKPPRLPPLWLLFTGALLLVALGCWVALEWK